MMDGHWKSDWECMTIDDLFALREQVDEILRERLKANPPREMPVHENAGT